MPACLRLLLHLLKHETSNVGRVKPRVGRPRSAIIAAATVAVAAVVVVEGLTLDVARDELIQRVTGARRSSCRQGGSRRGCCRS